MLEIIVLIIVVLLALLIGGWIMHQRNQKMANAFEDELESGDARDRANFHQRFDAVFDQIDDSSADIPDAKEPTLTLNDEAVAQTEPDEPQQQRTTALPNEPEWDLVIALTVMAPEGRLFTGRAIKNALDNHDLHFGDMQIYHRFTSHSRKQSLFSVANIVDPGTLLPAELISMKTPGLLLFARLPGPMNGMAIFDVLVETTHNLAQQLEGIVCDDNRQALSEKKLESIRSQIFELNLSLQKERPSYDDFN